ncbi:ankyrin repeat domain-containing protein [Tessaracoccus coleopterorum]|uniref:hypothetical protein n=1 Tax=Tessaracoccus coleopterorum TaxID=2714950 RepID=UPI0018D3CAB7|nr:hypothetical protein [Tessaracoccus coleopterorum]
MRTRDPSYVTAVLEAGAEPGIRHPVAKTYVLHEACSFPERSVLEPLIARVPDLDATDAEGITALHVCGVANQGALVLLLLEAGADPSPRTTRGARSRTATSTGTRGSSTSGPPPNAPPWSRGSRPAGSRSTRAPEGHPAAAGSLSCSSACVVTHRRPATNRPSTSSPQVSTNGHRRSIPDSQPPIQPKGAVTSITQVRWIAITRDRSAG